MAKLEIKCNGTTLVTIEATLEFNVPEKEFWASIINQPISFEGEYPKDLAYVLAALRLKDASTKVPVVQQLHPVREGTG